MKMKKKYRSAIWAIILITFTAFITSYFNGCFSTNKHEPTEIISANDSSTIVAPKNVNSPIKGDQNTAGRDVIQKKIEIKKGGTGFFDSSKQINNYNNAIEQRQLDPLLMAKILDSIPSKETHISIMAGGGMEGLNLAQMISQYLRQRGYKKILISEWALTGGYEKIEYKYESGDSLFAIWIHPRANTPQIQ